MKKNILYLILLLACTFLNLKDAKALPSSFENDFNEASEAQTERYYSKNPGALNQGTKQQRSSIERGRLSAESEGVGGLAPKESKHSANLYGPMAGIADTMYSKEHANQLGKFLGSPYVLYMTTMQLTEPAVAVGVHNSVTQGYGSQTTRYLAEEHFVRELESDPESRQILLPAYRECVANEMRKRDPTGASTTPEDDKASWIEAQSICMGDRSDSIKVAIPKAEQFDDLAKGGKGGAGFDMLMDRHSALWQNGSGASSYKDAETLFLTDYLFNQSNFDEIGLDAMSLRKSFEDLLGNYEFTVDKKASGGARSASRELNFKRIPPARPRAEVFDEAVGDNYQKIVDLVHMRCEFNKQVTAITKEANANKGFCAVRKDTLRDLFTNLSFVGFEFDCNMLEELFTSFSFENPIIVSKGNKSGQAKGAAEINCDVIKSKTYSELKDKSSVPKSGHANIVFLAGEITLGQMYMLVYNVQQTVEGLTAANKQFVKNFAYQLLNDFIGSGNFYDKYRAVVGNIEVFKQRLTDDIDRKRNRNNT